MNRTAYAQWAALLLRVTLGLMFFVAGINKITGMGLEQFQGYIMQEFQATWLPAIAVRPYAIALPWAELILGGLLTLGLLRFPVLVLSSLMMLSLAFGMMVASKPEGVNNILLTALFVAALMLTPYDRWTLDGLFRGRGGAGAGREPLP